MPNNTNNPTPVPLSNAGMLVVYTARANAALTEVSDRLRAAGLPESLTPTVNAQIATALAGVRLALTRWTPRPPLTDAAEEAALLATLDELIATRVNEVYAEVIRQRDTATARSQKALSEWNAARPVRDVKPTHEQWQRLHGQSTPDYDTMERIELGDGRFTFDYRLKPEKEERR